MKTTELKEAYHLAEMDSWDEKFKAEYTEQQAKRYNISHYVKGERREASQQIALRLIDMGLKDEEVLKATLLSSEDLEKIKNR